ncbi:MAG: 4-hydroxy-3-methylbut-2-enyl diphosphate reductase [Firmicutes bacterium]|nr:4-hydroxy-3-methylbut-2-enyl diphosphate reductase [Bacillota bacterium]
MIYIPKICGTCKGSTKALKIVFDVYEREQTKDNPKKIYIYKELLHNPKVIEKFENLGIETIDTLDNVTDNDIVIIRAHGEPKETYAFLESHNIEYYDATCANVSKIHQKVSEKYKAGYEIIVIGKSSHSEVIGTNGWCNNNAVIINDEDDFIKISKKNKKFIICQTTYNKEKFNSLVSKIEEIYEGFDIVVDNSLCSAVEHICKSSIDIAKKCDLMFVIGGSNSSNTNELYKLVSNITEAYKFSDINKFYKFILNEDISSKCNIGITGGASTLTTEIYNYKYLLEFILFYKDRLKELKGNQDIINNNLIKDNDNKIIKELVNDFIDLNKDGKYIRGTLIALGEFLATDKNKLNYLDLAYAYEMFQTSVLVHDDIIDNAKIRRGKETIPRRICQKYMIKKKNKTYQEDVLKLANSLGICAGDFGFYEANKILINNYSKNKNFAKLMTIYNDIIIKTIKGEIIDVTLPFMGKYDLTTPQEQDIIDIYHLKTSWYTIIGPFILGYVLGGKNTTEELENALNKIGIAFQLKDDILGIFAKSETIGKSNLSDIEEFKQTILYSHIINTPYKKDFLKIYGKKNIKEKDLLKIRELLKSSGSYDYAVNYLEKIYNESLSEIDNLDINDFGKDILKGLLIYIKIREK